MNKIFNDIKKESYLFNNSRDFKVNVLFESQLNTIYVSISKPKTINLLHYADIYENFLMHFRYRYNLKITYSRKNNRYKLKK